MKYLIWGVIGLIVVLWILHSKKARAGMEAPRPAVRADDDDAGAEPMMRCGHCGLHFPASEAVTGQDGAVFCSEEHRRQFAVR